MTRRSLARLLAAALMGGSAASAGAAAETKPSLAVFDFAITNTSGAATTPAETARLHALDAQMRQLLASRFTLIDAAPVRDKLQDVQSIRGCNGCEIDLARELGADRLAYGWVQKVSNLILNVNVVFEDVATGRTLQADSVDIRGNTDESWSRGLRYLVDERLFRND
jgi:hypothetical protein